MALRAKSICRHPGCGATIDIAGRCEIHARQYRQISDFKRGNSSERGYNGQWQKAREAYLSKHHLCVECVKMGRVVAASVVDHIKPHRLKEAIDSGDSFAIVKAQQLFWDSSNWQALCKTHHDVKTAREDGGFGRPGRGV